jgi:hypothetical protein
VLSVGEPAVGRVLAENLRTSSDLMPLSLAGTWVLRSAGT